MLERIATCFFLGVSLFYLFFAQELSFGMIAAPKAGFLPILAGTAACVLTVAIWVSRKSKELTAGITGIYWRKLFFIILGLIFYIIFLQMVGYIAATVMFLFYLFKVTDTVGWLAPGVLSTTVAISFFIVFVKLLGVILP